MNKKNLDVDDIFKLMVGWKNEKYCDVVFYNVKMYLMLEAMRYTFV